MNASKLQYSLTVTTQDTAVLYCLRALWHYAEGSKVPAAKSVPVRLFKDMVPEILEGGEMPLTKG